MPIAALAILPGPGVKVVIKKKHQWHEINIHKNLFSQNLIAATAFKDIKILQLPNCPIGQLTRIKLWT
jgi:hypothetical protein